jgi:hypothetical protein
MIKEYENQLRTIISISVGIQDGTDFGVTEERIEKWIEKREAERNKYKQVLLEPRIIYYSDFYDLKNIISKKWELIKPILNDKKRFEIFFDEVEKFRNTEAHGRELLTYQKNLLNGIVNDLKTQLIIYHNKNMNTDDYFIKLLKVSDSLGSSWEYGESAHKFTSKTLRVGDTIEFIIEAFDPKGREIEYELYTKGFKLKSKENSLQIKITNEMVGKQSGIDITVETINSEYKNSELCEFIYTILP